MLTFVRMGRSTPAKHTLETVRNIVTELKQALMHIEVCEATMSRNGIDSVVVTSGQAEMERGLQGITSFSSYLADAILDARRASGHYGAGAEVIEPETKGKKRKKVSR